MSESGRRNPEPPSGQAWFRGGIGHPGWHVSWPFGHLVFDRETLTIWGASMRVNAPRSKVRAIRLSSAVLAVGARVVWADGGVDPTYFAALSRRAVREALIERGWPVEETKFGRGVRSAT
jgi:hypothetical protein